jgi:uncharacterized protein (TIGR02246 family)
VKRHLLLAAIAMSAAACASPPPATEGTPDDEVAIRGLAGKYSAAFNANDAAAMAQLVSEDFENISADGAHTKGRAAFQKMEEQGIADRQGAGLKLTLAATTGYVRWIDAGHAVAGGTYTMAGLPPGAPDKGSWIIVVNKGADGRWVMTNSLVSEFVAPPAPAETKGKGQ